MLYETLNTYDIHVTMHVHDERNTVYVESPHQNTVVPLNNMAMDPPSRGLHYKVLLEWNWEPKRGFTYVTKEC